MRLEMKKTEKNCIPRADTHHLRLGSTAHFGAPTFSFSLSLVEKSVTFILKDAFREKEKTRTFTSCIGISY